jgi:hypothetical protein
MTPPAKPRQSPPIGDGAGIAVDGAEGCVLGVADGDGALEVRLGLE